MIRAITYLILLASCSDHPAEYFWFEDNWVSDRQNTLIENRRAGVSEERLSAFAPLYGDMQWTIHESSLLVSDSVSSQEYDFRIRPVSRSEFFIISDSFENHIVRTDYGFCVHFDGFPKTEEITDRMNIECYRKI